MEISREAVLNKTHYGLKIYAYVLRHYYPNQSVLSLNGRDCQVTRNPFNGGKETLKISIVDKVARHTDSELKDFEGDALDFASFHFKIAEEEPLLIKINKLLGLNLKVEQKDNLDWIYKDDTWYAYCSFYKAPIRNVFPAETVRLHNLYERIKGDEYKEITERFRAIKDPKSARKFKANHFDYVTFSGIFSKRSDEELLKHSSLLTIDFDHLENLEELKELLLLDDYFETEMLFTSPSGDGLKWIIRINLSEVSHAEYFKAVANYIKQTYNIEVDQSGKDISRACFLCHDPAVYLNKRHQKL